MVKDIVKNENGQAVTEYILMMAMIVSIYLLFTAGLVRIGLAKKLMQPMTDTFTATYQFGHPKAKGYDNGGPEYHPRALGGQNNFRIFFNPRNN
jgi:hypothetical protein